MVHVIDNPLRRRLQPPEEAAKRHGIEPGMVVLEVGPGKGNYTFAAARRAGPQGKVIAVDIEPKIIEHIKKRIQAEGIGNIEARVADVYQLPFADGTFDVVSMIAVSGEIPDLARALKEFYRVLKPSGTLAFSEILVDPDYPLPSTLIKKCSFAGFRLKQKQGSIFWYTLVFEKA
jgi:ubiquinone/menaquinone biosynthesis C-methylase UbiE